MKKVLFLLAILILFVCLANCTLSNSASPTKISVINAKSFYIGKSTNTNKCVVKKAETLSTVDTLYAITQDGIHQPVTFYDNENQPIQVDISSTYRIKKIRSNCDSFIGISFYYASSSYGYLLDVNTGLLYDFSSYDLSSLLIYNNYLYALSNGTAYSIDISTMDKALPYNNGAIDPISGFLPLKSGDIISLIGPYIDTNLGNMYQSKVYFSDTSIIPKKITNIPSLCSGEQSWVAHYFYDDNGDLYVITLINAQTFYLYKVQEDPQNGVLLKEIKSSPISRVWGIYGFLNGGYHSTNDLLFTEDVKLPIITTGLLEVNFVNTLNPTFTILPDTYPYDTNSRSPVYVIGNDYYYYINKCIGVRSLEQGSTCVSIYTDPNMFDVIWSINDSIYFYNYINATTIGTFRINKNLTLPEIFCTSKAEIREIINIY